MLLSLMCWCERFCCVINDDGFVVGCNDGVVVVVGCDDGVVVVVGCDDGVVVVVGGVMVVLLLLLAV